MNCGLSLGRRSKTTREAGEISVALFRLVTPPCDISAEPFVAKQSQSATTACNVEAVFFVSCLNAPKLCLGETHVPVRFSTWTRKNTSGCRPYPLCTPLVDCSH